MIALFLWIALGLALLLAGSEVAVAAGRRVAARAGLSDLLIGLTVTSIGTSLPELATTAGGALASGGPGGEAAAGVAVGNILGSNLFVLTVLLGAASLISTLKIDGAGLRRDALALAGVSALAAVLLLTGQISRIEGVLLLIPYGLWLARVLRDEAPARGEAAPEPPPHQPSRLEAALALLPGPPWAVELGVSLLGLAALLGGAALLVQQGVSAATHLGVSGMVVGLAAGVGTSLPELVVTLAAARQGAHGLAVGNALGSAITNLTLCLGGAALFHPLPVPARALEFDLPFLGAATVMSLALMWENRDLTRAEGLCLAVLFLLYAYLRLAVI